MAIYSIKGSKVSIGAAIAMKSGLYVAADFVAAGRMEIKEPESLGTVSDTFAEIAFDNITDGRTKVLKGAVKGDPITLTFGRDYADAGQVAVMAAVQSDGDFGFVFELADKPVTGAAPKNSTRMVACKVMSAAEVFDAVNSVWKLTVTLQPNSNIVAVNASPT